VAERFTKASIDLGIVTSDGDRSLAFYRDTLGLTPEFSVPLYDGGVMHRLLCGTSIFKIMAPGVMPQGGITSTAPDEPTTTVEGLVELCVQQRGFRFISIWVADIDAAFAQCVRDGAPVVYPAMESRPGVRVAVVEDPDGNWVEFVEMVDADVARDDLATKHDLRAEAAAASS
jgi:catechol 2,3-dioxygenase-like lactoylglutathione lyase family enzyme